MRSLKTNPVKPGGLQWHLDGSPYLFLAAAEPRHAAADSPQSPVAPKSVKTSLEELATHVGLVGAPELLEQAAAAPATVAPNAAEEEPVQAVKPAAVAPNAAEE